MILQVYVGKNLNYTVGSLQYISDTSDPTSDTSATTSDTTETTTIILVFAAIATVMVLIIILLVIAIICIVRKKTKKKSTTAFTDNTGVHMYASPAYGTHQIFTEPGLDHLYEHIDEYCKDDNGIDTEGYLKMNPSCKVADHATTKGNDGNTESQSGLPSDEYVHAAADDDHMTTNGNDEDDGYENEDQPKNGYLQLKADH